MRVNVVDSCANAEISILKIFVVVLQILSLLRKSYG
jgi:hypothetical protein